MPGLTYQGHRKKGTDANFQPSPLTQHPVNIFFQKLFLTVLGAEWRKSVPYFEF